MGLVVVDVLLGVFAVIAAGLAGYGVFRDGKLLLTDVEQASDRLSAASTPPASSAGGGATDT